jgi:hypothetical protein
MTDVTEDRDQDGAELSTSRASRSSTGEAGRGEGRPGEVGGAGIQHVLAQLAAQHVLRRQVVDELRVGQIVRPGRPGPAMSKAVADRDGQRPVGILQTRRLGRRAPLVTQVGGKVPLELGQRVTGRLTRGPCWVDMIRT